MIIKLNDLKKLHEEFRNELISAFEETLDKSDFIQGKNVTTFENDFAKFTASNYAISCANGTDALIIALKALNLIQNQQHYITHMVCILFVRKS